jgi:hypothetical protein
LGVALALKMIPEDVLAECRGRSEVMLSEGKPINRKAAAIIVAIWVLLGVLAIALVLRIVSR